MIEATPHTTTTEVKSEIAEVCAQLMWEAGATGVEVVDDEIQPMPSAARPSPGHTRLTGYFDTAADARRALDWLGLRGAEAQLAAVPVKPWATDWRQHFHPVKFSERLWVAPSWDVPTVAPGAQVVVIDPGLAFGTGTHESTALCLRSIDAILARRTGARVLDVGTGSGILAIAATKLGAASVVATDNDPTAVRVAVENAAHNKISLSASTSTLEEITGTYDLVIANILAGTLIAMAPSLAPKVAAGGDLLLSGLLEEQLTEVEAAYVHEGLSPQTRVLDGAWGLLHLHRA